MTREGDYGPVCWLSVFPSIRIDSCYLQWQFGLRVSLNPLKRINQYREVQHLKADRGIILDSFRTYLENMQNVYGLTMVEESTPGSLVEQTTHIAGDVSYYRHDLYRSNETRAFFGSAWK